MRYSRLLSHRDFAYKLLARIHAGIYVLDYVELIHKHLRAGNLEPKDIFTTYEHLEELRVKILQLRVLTWMNQIRLSRVEEVVDVEFSQERVIQLIRDNKMTEEQLTSVGITYEELALHKVFI